MSVGFRLVVRRVYSPGYTALNLTEMIGEVVSESGLREGLVTVYSPERRVIVLLVEFEPSLLGDLEGFISRYSNDYQGVVEALFDKSVSVPVVDGVLDLGVFKHIVLVDLSRREGEKEVVVGLEGVFA